MKKNEEGEIEEKKKEGNYKKHNEMKQIKTKTGNQSLSLLNLIKKIQ
jgi:hypothetical protein